MLVQIAERSDAALLHANFGQHQHMPPLKIRDLGSVGVITDVDPYDLPTQAWSMGVNVRFQNKRIQRAPIYRNVHTLAQSDPRFCVGALPTSGLDFLGIGYLNGRIYSYSAGAETNISASGYVDNNSELRYTSCHLADVLYVNRGDRVPWSKGPADSIFHALGSAWDSTWRAGLIRSCGGALVALNVTKGASSFPTMVKTSSIPLSGAVPSSWDDTTPSTLATENILAEMEGGIIDAQTLGNRLFIFGLNETWSMTPSNDIEVFNYDLMPFGKGAMNANCSITIGGRQYVFGPNDIWMHDGVTHTSICDHKTRQYIYSTLNLSKALRCFVNHNVPRNELHFCYVSGDGFINFNGGLGCNRAAVFNYVDGTWQFDDLPLVFAATQANLDTTLTYATITSTYDTVGGTYLDQEDSFKRVLTFVGESNTTYSLSTSLYAFDPFGVGSTVSFPVDLNANKSAYLERSGIDLDEVDEDDLSGYKVLTSIIPQARLGADAAALQFSFGAADTFNQAPTYAAYQSYNGSDLYKIDFMSAGRYLAMRVLFPDYREMSISGLDLYVETTGER